MNKKQMLTMAKLSDWQPEALAGWRVGDLCQIQTLGRCQVARLVPPSEIVVRTSTGASARVGWKVLERVTS